MGRIIAVANQKGGVGKTTTTINLSASLAEQGKKVLLVDLDPQGNATSGVGVDKRELENTVYELLLDEITVDECVIETDFLNLSVLPSNINLSGVEIDLLDMEDREYCLKNILDKEKGKYDFIMIDCPPSLSMLTVNAMTTAGSVLVPIQCEYYAMEGLSQLIHTINLVKKKLNPALAMEGVVFTMYDSRTNLSQEVVDSVKEVLEERVFETTIPRNVRLAEAPSYGMPICAYDAKSAGAESYNRLADEIINGR